ncbi:ABC transporter ATP-binding protein [Clostridium oryzae]|uniref:Putative ABC transporter ATP-binding protein YbhF n=1 Tax=Clostridium oryzae TaxID=1450648 RepID=A0A1V4IDH8_9CLOT|nr:ABC transporter ATP-binding protein [Clostridium oryzae]OPJ57940.1 putative ABC transporter ATP-binding protein YbhF [Clostridium oryzae]
MEDSISIKHLRKCYKDKVAVEDLSISVKRGEIFGLLGHNGAGKSTTIDCVLGLKKFESGEVSILGMNPVSHRRKLFEKVGVQLQQSSYQDGIKVGELCEEISALYKAPADYRKLLADFRLSGFEKKQVANLSGGERQKLSVLLALIPDPEVLFLDELTTGLDTLARREVWKHLESLKEKQTTIFLTSHYMDEVEALCDRVCIIRNGKEVVSGSVKKVIEKSPYDRLEEAYIWYMEEAEQHEKIS